MCVLAILMFSIDIHLIGRLERLWACTRKKRSHHSKPSRGAVDMHLRIDILEGQCLYINTTEVSIKEQELVRFYWSVLRFTCCTWFQRRHACFVTSSAFFASTFCSSSAFSRMHVLQRACFGTPLRARRLGHSPLHMDWFIYILQNSDAPVANMR